MRHHFLLLLVLLPLLSGCDSSWKCHDGVLYEQVGASNVYVECKSCKACIIGDKK